MRKDWNQAKGQVAPCPAGSWWAECSKEADNTGLDQLARAGKNWAESKKGERKGRRMGFSRLESRRRHIRSVRFTLIHHRRDPLGRGPPAREVAAAGHDQDA